MRPTLVPVTQASTQAYLDYKQANAMHQVDALNASIFGALLGNDSSVKGYHKTSLLGATPRSGAVSGKLVLEKILALMSISYDSSTVDEVALMQAFGAAMADKAKAVAF